MSGSNDAELSARTFNGASRAYAERAMQRVLAWIEWAEDGDDATNPGMCADDVKTALAFAASERSHDGEWEAMRDTLKRIAEGDEPRPVGKSWNTDRTPSKHDKCIHDVWMYQDCGQCVAEFAGAALGSAVSLSDDVG